MKSCLLKPKRLATVFITVYLLLVSTVYGQTSTVTFSDPTNNGTAANTWKAPAGVTTIVVELWGGGGAGGTSNANLMSGGGGGGGAYTKATVPVTPFEIYSISVGTGGVSSTSDPQGGGQSSITLGPKALAYANGGAAGGMGAVGVNGRGGAGGTGGTYNGGAGDYGSKSSFCGGGGGGSAGILSKGNNASVCTGASAVLGGGAGGNGGRSDQYTNAPGLNGSAPGGGGGGAYRSNATLMGGRGGNGKVIISYTCPAFSLSSISATPICSGGNSIVTLNSSVDHLPNGTYTVTYDLSGANSAINNTAPMEVNNGTGSFSAPMDNAGSTTVTVTNLALGSCASSINVNNTTAVDVSAYASPFVSIEQTEGANPACVGSAVTFSATPSNVGNGTVTYDFQVDGVSVQNSSSDTYTTSSLTEGSHRVTCTIYISGGGCLTSTTATSTPVAINVVNTPPAVTTQAPTNIITSAALIPGTISDMGCTALSGYGVEYSATGFSSGTVTSIPGSNLSGANFSVALTGLMQGTTYYYRTYAINNGGMSYSSENSFTTPAQATTSLSVNPVRGTYGGTAILSAVLRSGDNGISGKTVTFSLNGIPISQPATTDASGMATLEGVSLAGIRVGTYTAAVSATFAGDPAYTPAEGSAQLQVDKAPSSLRITKGTYTFDGEPQGPSSAIHSGSGGAIQYTYSGTTFDGVTFGPTADLPVRAGTYHVTATLEEDDNYSGASDSKDFNVEKARSFTVVTITGAPFTYTGSPVTPASATVTGVDGVSLVTAPVVTYTNNTHAGTNTASASYSYEGDNNYFPSGDSKTFSIGKAASMTIITITGGPFTYTGAEITPATVLVTGAGALDEAASPAYINNVNAGTATVRYDFPGDDNHEGSTATETFVIGKASSTTTISLADGPFTFTGSAITPASVTVTGAGGLNLSPAADYINNVNAGTATARYTFEGDDNHTGSENSRTFEIGKAPAVIALTNLSHTYDGTTKSAGYTISPGGVPGVSITGNDQVDAGIYPVTASLENDNYAAAGVTGDLVIGKAPSVTTVTIKGGPFSYTGAAIEPATVTVTGAGGLDEAPAALYSHNTGAGTATASYSFGGDANHTGSGDSKTFEIGKATATVNLTGLEGQRYTGSAITAGVTTFPAGLAVNLTYNGAAQPPLAAGSYAVEGTITDANYSGSASGSLVIGKATTRTEVTIAPGTYSYTGSAIRPATVSVTGSDGLRLSPQALYSNNVNAGIATASYSYAGDANHEASGDSRTFTIARATTTTVVSITGGPFSYTGFAQTPAIVVVRGPGGLSLSPEASYENNTNAGTATAGYRYAGDGNYEPSGDSKTFAIGKSDASIVVDPYTVTYDGKSHRATGVATGVNGEPLTGLNLEGTTHTGAGKYTDSWSFTDGTGNYNDRPATMLLNEIQARSITVTPHSSQHKTYGDPDPELYYTASEGLLEGNTFTGALNRTPGEDVGQYRYDLGTLSAGANYHITLVTATAPGMMAGAVTEETFEIAQRDLQIVAAGVDKVYDGTTKAVVELSSDGLPADAIALKYASATFDDPEAGDNKPIVVSGLSIGGAKAGNYRLSNTTATDRANILKAGSQTTLTTSAAAVRYMDNVTMNAKVRPLNTASPLTGTIEFFIGSQSYGLVPVVPVMGAADGSVEATLVRQVRELPAAVAYNVKALFRSANTNYSNSEHAKELTVMQRDASPADAKGFYTGDIFGWTTGLNSGKATVTLSTRISDINGPKGDLRAAKVTFYYVNSSTLTPIPGAKDLPVGLVDINDGSQGFASAIVQFDIGSQNAQSYGVAVRVHGAYKNDPLEIKSGTILTISKPIEGGYIVGGSQIINTDKSSGYIKGAVNEVTGYQFDIQYTKSGTNPKGKTTVLINSYNKPDGTPDDHSHTYLVITNAIASLNVAADKVSGISTGTFNAKANLYERIENLTTEDPNDFTDVLLESGATFQMITSQGGCDQKIAITFYRKAGGIWFSSNWDRSATVLQPVARGSVVKVAGGGACPSSSIVSSQVRRVEEVQRVELSNQFILKAYPNPTCAAFNLQVSANKTHDAIQLRVVDVFGRTVEIRNNVAPNGTLKLGENYKAGIYLVELIQGSNHQQVKLVKQ